MDAAGVAVVEPPATADPALFAGRWLVLQTLPQYEKKTAAYLSIRSVHVYLPTLARRGRDRYTGKKRIWHAPLFSRYLFACPETDDHLCLCLESAGVCGDIRVADQAKFRGELHNLYLAQAARLDATVYPCIPRGTKVCVLPPHPLQGVVGESTGERDKLQLIIKITTLGQAIGLSIDPECLEVIGSSWAA